jgi:NAD(P) transhydrogenase subunit alpha
MAEPIVSSGLVDAVSRLPADAAMLLAQVGGQGEAAGHDPLLFGLTVLVLAVIVGYYVVWSVTPALHSPLMGVTNAVSSVIIVGALIAAGPAVFDLSKGFGLAAVILASINIFGGFIVTQRMLAMFRRRRRD